MSGSAGSYASELHHDLSMTDQEIEEWNAAIEASEARCAAISQEVEDMASRGVLRNLVFREDEVIQNTRNDSRSSFGLQGELLILSSGILRFEQHRKLG